LLPAVFPLRHRQRRPPAPSTPGRPNIPDTFTSLTVLPANISKPDLMAVMKQCAVTMKVRGSACHAVSGDLSEGSFASDEKPMKGDARKLIHLLQQTATALKP